MTKSANADLVPSEAANLSDSTVGEPSVSSGDDYIVAADSDITPILSVIMPTLNEQEGIESCLLAIKSAVAKLEVPTEIIVSDSSTDRTPEIAASHGAIVVEPDQPGYGYAYQYAFACARGTYIAIGDADTTYDFEELPKLFKLVSENDADMALGSRLDGEIRPGAMPPLHQYIGNPLLTKFLNTFYDAGVSDAHSGMRVISSEALEQLDLETTGMEFASEMIMEAGEQGLTIEERPITYHEREGEATLDSFRDGWRHVRFMLVNAPGYLFLIPGILFGIFGVSVMLLAQSGLSLNGITLGIHSMIAGSLFTVTGFQALSLGVFSALAADPVRKPSDPITPYVLERVQLEHGIGAGMLFTSIGTGYALFAVLRWINSGFATLPLVQNDIAAFTMIVLGLQFIFNAFFFSAIND